MPTSNLRKSLHVGRLHSSGRRHTSVRRYFEFRLLCTHYRTVIANRYVKKTCLPHVVLRFVLMLRLFQRPGRRLTQSSGANAPTLHHMEVRCRNISEGGASPC